MEIWEEILGNLLELLGKSQGNHGKYVENPEEIMKSWGNHDKILGEILGKS